MKNTNKNKKIMYLSLIFIFIYLLGRNIQTYFALKFTDFNMMTPYFTIGFVLTYIWLACICILIYLFYEKSKNGKNIKSKVITTGAIGIGAFAWMTAVYTRMGVNMLHEIPEFQTIIFDEINRSLMDEGIPVVVDSITFSNLGIMLLMSIILTFFVAGIFLIWGICSKNLKRVLIACFVFGLMILFALAFGVDFIHSNQWLQNLIQIEINFFRY